MKNLPVEHHRSLSHKHLVQVPIGVCLRLVYRHLDLELAVRRARYDNRAQKVSTNVDIVDKTGYVQPEK